MVRCTSIRVACLLVWFTAGVASAAEPMPWDVPFKGQPKAMLEAAAKLEPPEGADVEWLLADFRYEVDDQRRVHITRRQVLRVLTEQGVRTAGSFNMQWATWHEERPKVRARVIAASGEEHPFDPATINEAPAVAGDLVFTDQRVLRAPLPAIAIGSISEVEITIREARPFFAAGSLFETRFHSFDHIRQVKLRVDWPAKTPVKFQFRGLPREPTRSEEGGRGTLTYEAGPLSPLALEDFESHSPPETRPLPKVAFTTGASWKEIAAGYHELVEKQLKGFDAEAVLATVEKGKTRAEKIALLIHRVQSAIRYTGLTFGEAAIVPYRPEETLGRRYGDCKDQSALCVALLRASGIDAKVALLATGAAEDVSEELPALSCFNHAIVYVPGEPALWIDPVAGKVRLGELPLIDQGRRALIFDPQTVALKRTSTTTARQNRMVETREVHLGEWFSSRMRHQIEAHGAFEQDYRANHRDVPLKETRKRWEEHYRQAMQPGTRVTEFEHTPVDDLSGPFRLQARCEAGQFGQTSGELLHIQTDLVSCLENLPAFLWQPAGEKPRKGPMQLSMLYEREIVDHFIPPRGFVVRQLPESGSLEAGPASLRWTFTHRPDGGVDFRAKFDTGSGRFTAEEVETLRAGLANLPKDVAGQLAFDLEFDHIVLTHLRNGKLAEAATTAARLAAEEPDYAWHHLRLGQVYLQLGFGEAGRGACRRAVELAPKLAPAHHFLGLALARDPLGRLLTREADRAGALAAVRRATELEPANGAARVFYCLLLEHDDHGVRYAPAQMSAALAAHRQCKTLPPDQQQQWKQLYPIALLVTGNTAELKDFAQRNLPDTSSMLIAALASQQGATVADTRASEMGRTAEGRRFLLYNASELLGHTRQYALAAQLMERCSTGAPTAQDLRDKAARLKTYAQIDGRWLPETDPALAVQRLHYWLLVGGPRHPEVTRLFTSPPTLAGPLQNLEREMAYVRRTNPLQSPFRRGDAISGIKFRKLGGSDAEGYRIKANGWGPTDEAWYVVKTADGYRLWDVGPHSSSMGAAALRELDAGRREVAVQYLDWAVADHKQGWNLLNPFAGHPVVSLWMACDRNEPADIRLAAQVLAVLDPTNKEATAALREARDKVADSRKVYVDRALLTAAYTAKDHAAVVAVAERLLVKYPNERDVVVAWALAQDSLGQNEEARRTADKWLQDPLRETGGRLAVAYLAARAGDFPLAAKHLQVLSKGNDPLLLNALAWVMLSLEPAADAEALTAAQLAAQKLHHPFTLRTLAAAQSEAGLAAEAQQTLLDAAALNGEIDIDDILVQGRMAEKLGLAEAAVAAYRKVLASDAADTGTRRVAERGLARLQAKSPPGSTDESQTKK